MKKYEAHPFAELFPMIDGEDLKGLIEDIKTNGQRAPITLFEDRILDGRNRYRACLEAGVDPKFREHKGDALSFVLSVNLHRRHLTASQRAMVAAKIANFSHGGDRKSQAANLPLDITSQQTASDQLKVSPRSLRSAKELLAKSPAKAKEVDAGKKTVHAALKELNRSAPAVSNNIPKDKEGHEIPECIIEDWNRAAAVKEHLNSLSKIKCFIDKGIEEDDLIFREINQNVVADLSNAYQSIKRIIPHSVCVTCQGHQRKKCTACKGRGFISDFMYAMCVPEEIKKIRALSLK